VRLAVQFRLLKKHLIQSVAKQLGHRLANLPPDLPDAPKSAASKSAKGF
jgi:hypothetical protein